MHWGIYAIVGAIGTLYFGAALVDILSDWERFRLKMQARGAILSRPVTTALIGLMIVGSLFVINIAWTSYREENPAPPKTAEEAQKFVLGTWVYATPITPQTPHVTKWQRWVIRGDGTVDIYQAEPASDTWGQPMSFRYVMDSAKYQDTGARFYVLAIPKTEIWANIEEDGALLVHDSGKVMAVLSRGDKNPFSK